MELFFLLLKIETYLEDQAHNHWQRFVNEDGKLDFDDFDGVDLLHEAVEHICEGESASLIDSLDSIANSAESIEAVNRMFDGMELIVREHAEDAAEWSRAQSHGIPGILRYHGLSMKDFV